MGAALLFARAVGGAPLDGAEFDRVLDCHPARVRRLAACRTGSAEYRLAVWSDDPAPGSSFAEDHRTGSWLAVIGNPTRADLRSDGHRSAQHLLAECVARGPEALDDVSPPFAALFHDGRKGHSYAATDRFGFQHLYIREEPAVVWVASAGLALARALPSTLDHDAAAEWLAMGHFMSDRTLFREQRKLRCGERIQIGRDGPRSIAEWQPALAIDNAATRSERLDRFVDSFVESVKICASGPGIASELTGGIDSRLLLAAVLEAGVPAIAWTQAQASWDELRIVGRLRQAVPFEHFHAVIDDSFVDRLPALVDETTDLSDGETNALIYAPLLLAFEQLQGRRDVSLSGVAGEIARGFYFGQLGAPRQERGVPLDALLNKETRPAAMLRTCFRAELDVSPIRALRQVLARFVEASPGSSPEAILEDLYIRARLQRFAGRNFSFTGYFCRQGLPYFTHDFVDLVLSLPYADKTDGRILRHALMKLNPALASVPLNGGMTVAPASRARPDRTFRRTLALARRAASKYGGPTGRRFAGRGVESVPWDAARVDPRFRTWVRDLLLDRDTQTASFLDRDVVSRVIERSVGGSSLYPLGLLLTLELTLRKAGTGS